jgi:hypothetical protein
MFAPNRQANPAAGDAGGIRTRSPGMRNPLPDPVKRRGVDRIANEPFWAIDRRNQALDRCVRAALNAKLCHGLIPCWQGLAQGLVSLMSYATFSRVHCIAISPSTFNALLFDKRRSSAQGAPS